MVLTPMLSHVNELLLVFLGDEINLLHEIVVFSLKSIDLLGKLSNKVSLKGIVISSSINTRGLDAAEPKWLSISFCSSQHVRLLNKNFASLDRLVALDNGPRARLCSLSLTAVLLVNEDHSPVKEISLLIWVEKFDLRYIVHIFERALPLVNVLR